MNSTIAHHEQQERDADKCPGCGRHTLEDKKWCVAQNDWAMECTKISDAFCTQYLVETCEGLETYRYCRACGFKEAV